MKKLTKIIFITAFTISFTVILTFSIVLITVKDFSILQYDFIKSIFYFSVLLGIYMSVLSNLILNNDN